MTNTSPKIVFFGTEDFSLASLQVLVERGFPIELVVTKPDTPRGRGHTLTPPAVKIFAEQHSIPVMQPDKITDITDAIVALQPVTGVLVSFGKIIPQSIIDLFTPGIINVHPSLLPLYRGPTPIESAIINGDAQTGVSIMQLDRRMDAGPVYTQITHELNGTETQNTLYDTLSSKGAHILTDTLPRIIDGTLTPTTQQEENATYCALLSKSDALIDPTAYTAHDILRKIRAHESFPRTKHTFGEHIVIILTAKASEAPTKLSIPCKNSTHLNILTLIAPSGKRMTGEEFYNGYLATK